MQKLELNFTETVHTLSRQLYITARLLYVVFSIDSSFLHQYHKLSGNPKKSLWLGLLRSDCNDKFRIAFTIVTNIELNYAPVRNYITHRFYPG